MAHPLLRGVRPVHDRLEYPAHLAFPVTQVQRREVALLGRGLFGDVLGEAFQLTRDGIGLQVGELLLLFVLELQVRAIPAQLHGAAAPESEESAA